ncbi:SDR family oxidoreductase [Protaetiibacter larvae]|uniref:SDR family NAD(P)-dependent oxidoreductase n=1 Tax=Protaetiibacter larvae TaxID=2592654 RepID=A0A5C1Y7F5_9MICO|nr:SDR family oxidoreductase [Protaetiibacter larvae]QEO09736.1 SDR family NAD(P)-dependent oxidoreductase [Protaetiibacter larvae]
MYQVPDQTGRRIIVTGANSGTGKETTRRLAAAGAEIVMAVRSLERGAAARDELLAENPAARLELRRIDLGELATVRAFADDELADDRPLHVLVNNAGVMTPPKRLETADGFELQFGSNFLGPFLLTTLLLPKLLEADAPRVATMSSGTANFGGIRFDDLQWTRRYVPFRAYAQSKLADTLLGIRLAEIARQNGWALRSTIAHPGYTRTNLQTAGRNLAYAPEQAKPPIQRTILPSQTVAQGAEPLLFATADPAAELGAYYGPSGWGGLVGPTHRARLPRSARVGSDLAERLWAVAEELVEPWRG